MDAGTNCSDGRGLRQAERAFGSFDRCLHQFLADERSASFLFFGFCFFLFLVFLRGWLSFILSHRLVNTHTDVRGFARSADAHRPPLPEMPGGSFVFLDENKVTAACVLAFDSVVLHHFKLILKLPSSTF